MPYVIDDIIAPVKSDMEQMRPTSPTSPAARTHSSPPPPIRSSEEKRLCPVLVFLVARATAQLMSMTTSPSANGVSRRSPR